MRHVDALHLFVLALTAAVLVTAALDAGPARPIDQSGHRKNPVPSAACQRNLSSVAPPPSGDYFEGGAASTSWPSFTGSVAPGLNEVRTMPSLPDIRYVTS